MKAQTEKAVAKQSQAVAGAYPAAQLKEEPEAQFEDNRAEVVGQRKMAGKAASSPQSGRIAQLQAAANRASPGIVQREEFREKEKIQNNYVVLQKNAEKPTNNTGLPDDLKSGMENLSGMPLDHVRVHYNSPKPAAVKAHAYAQGNNIHLSPGQEQHLPHELGHVIQQEQGKVKPTVRIGGMAVNDDAGLEQEATTMGQQALQRFIQDSRQSDDQSEIAADHITTTAMSTADYAKWKDSIQCQTQGLHGACTVGEVTYVAQFHDPAAVIQMMEWRDKLKIGLVALEGILTIAAGGIAAATPGGFGVLPGIITACIGASKCGRAYLMYDMAVTKDQMEKATDEEKEEHQKRVDGRTRLVNALRGLEAVGSLAGGGLLIAEGGFTTKTIALSVFAIAKSVRAVTTAFANYLNPRHKVAKKILDSISAFSHAVEVVALGFAAEAGIEAAEDKLDTLGGAGMAVIAGSKGLRTLDQAYALFEKKKPKKKAAKDSNDVEFEEPAADFAEMEKDRKHRIVLMLQSLFSMYPNMDQDGLDQFTDEDFGDFVLKEDKSGLKDIVSQNFQSVHKGSLSDLSSRQVGEFILTNEYS